MKDNHTPAYVYTPKDLNRVCAHCGYTYGKHTARGDYCPTSLGQYSLDTVFEWSGESISDIVTKVDEAIQDSAPA